MPAQESPISKPMAPRCRGNNDEFDAVGMGKHRRVKDCPRSATDAYTTHQWWAQARKRLTAPGPAIGVCPMMDIVSFDG